MFGAILGIHVLVCAALVVVVLLQSGKGGGLAGAFGGGGGVGAVFGGQTAATFLTKSTRYLAIAFMLTSLTLAMVIRGRSAGTVAEGLEGRQATPATTAGEVIPTESAPEGVPGGLPDAETPAPAQQTPVAPETEPE